MPTPSSKTSLSGPKQPAQGNLNRKFENGEIGVLVFILRPAIDSQTVVEERNNSRFLDVSTSHNSITGTTSITGNIPILCKASGNLIDLQASINTAVNTPIDWENQSLYTIETIRMNVRLGNQRSPHAVNVCNIAPIDTFRCPAANVDFMPSYALLPNDGHPSRNSRIGSRVTPESRLMHAAREEAARQVTANIKI
jgi:hypothetical protein